MIRCQSIRPHLTAAADRELSPWRSWQVRRHLDRCDACRSEADKLQRTVSTQITMLRQLMAAPEIPIDEMRRRLRVAIAAEPAINDAPWQWHFSFRPVFAGAAVMLLAISTAVWGFGGPTTALIALGWVEPPSAVAAKTDLFQDYPLIEQLDALENFDSVNAVPLEEEQTSFHHASWVG
ncbi:MAG TPA: anti-sigma factor [Terriglobales bacterium]|nr:anti-sigma factor [Terriglobales bacterium]